MDGLKFVAIISCFLISLLNRTGVKQKRDELLLRIGMLFTVIADYSIIIRNNHHIGVIIFCFVQTIYNYRFTEGKRAVRFGAYASLTALLVFLIPNTLEFKIKLGIIYAVCLLGSVSGVFIAYKKEKYNPPVSYLLPAAMILFLLCDINVAIYNLGVFGAYNSVVLFMIWLFYLPSQFLLALGRTGIFVLSGSSPRAWKK